MKKRLGFVSNSSSTSYTCSLCGEDIEAWDYDDIKVYSLIRCDHGHIYHLNCLPSSKEVKEVLKKDNLSKVPKHLCSICKIMGYDK